MVNGLEDVGWLQIGCPCRPGMVLSKIVWFERSRKYLGRRLGGSKT